MINNRLGGGCRGGAVLTCQSGQNRLTPCTETYNTTRLRDPGRTYAARLAVTASRSSRSSPPASSRPPSTLHTTTTRTGTNSSQERNSDMSRSWEVRGWRLCRVVDNVLKVLINWPQPLVPAPVTHCAQPTYYWFLSTPLSPTKHY